MIGVSHLSLGVNSSINFLIYYSLGINIYYPSRARAVTVSQCPHSGVGQDFLLRRRVTLTKTAVTRKQKDKNRSKSAEGYKQLTKIGPKSEKFCQKKDSLFYSNHVPATTGQCCPKKKYPFPK